jgi:hypothetical protein
MTSPLFAIAPLVLAAEGLRRYPVAKGDGEPARYFELVEANAHIIYPVLAALVLALIVAGILQAWRAHDLDGMAKAKLKREVMGELRLQTGGTTAESLARAVKLEPFKLVRLLEEMQRDGLLMSHTNTHRLTVWQIRRGQR